MEDMKIKCQDCGEEFIFNTAEQTFYKEKGLALPKRCRQCRQIRKERMKNGNKKENN